MKPFNRIILFILIAMVATTACSSPGTSEETVPTAVPPTEPPPATQTPTPLPTQTPAEVQAVENVLYATAVDPAAEDQLLDLFYLPGSQEEKPVVIYAHGSGQTRSSAKFLARQLAREGYVVLSINWHDDFIGNRQDAHLREAMENARCALSAAAEQAAAYGADTQRVIWTGFSGGAWLGSMISFGQGDLDGLLDQYAELHDGPSRRVRCTAAAEPARITAYIPSAGAFPGDYWLANGVNSEWTELFAPVRDFAAVGHNPDLKVRLIHGKQDFSYETRFEDAQSFAAALETAGYDVVFLPQKGSHESFQQQIIEQVLALDQD